VRVGYDRSFDPVSGALDPDMKIINEQEAKALVEKMKAHCNCH
jgi:hypothetical protein